MKKIWTEPVIFEDHDWNRINTILGRNLTVLERYEIKSNISKYASMKSSFSNVKTSAQNIRRGLKKFANLPNDKVIDALGKTLPSSIRAEIQSALIQMKLPFDGNAPAIYKAAALLALHTMPDGDNGPKPIGYRLDLAKYIVTLWKYLGRDDVNISENESYGTVTPLVKFALSLIEVIEQDDPPSFSTVAKLLREVIA